MCMFMHKIDHDPKSPKSLFHAAIGECHTPDRIARVVPPLLTEFRSRGHAAMGNFCFGGTPPMAVFGRS
jgi:hypothetical protein